LKGARFKIKRNRLILSNKKRSLESKINGFPVSSLFDLFI